MTDRVTSSKAAMAPARAVRDHGYAMKAVADFIGRHYVTVSRAVARFERQTSAPEMSECKT